MRFVVEWKRTATDELAGVWLDATSADRRLNTAAAGRADDLLHTDPYAQSESRDGDRRIMFVAPLAVTFRVDAQAYKVDVLRVRRFR